MADSLQIQGDHTSQEHNIGPFLSALSRELLYSLRYLSEGAKQSQPLQTNLYSAKPMRTALQNCEC